MLTPKQMTKSLFIGFRKIEPLGFCQSWRSTAGRPANGHFSDRCSHRSTGESTALLEWTVGRPIRSTGNFQRATGLGRSSIGRVPVDWYAHAQNCACRSSAGRLPVDRSLRNSEKSELPGPGQYGFWFRVLDKIFWSWKIIEYEHVSYYYQGKILGKNSFDKNLIVHEMFFQTFINIHERTNMLAQNQDML